MKVRIYSWFKSGNIGDILIAEMSKKIFANQFECEYFDIVTGNKVKKMQILKYEFAKSSLKSKIFDVKFLYDLINFVYSFKKSKVAEFENIKQGECDFAVFFGGNSLMDLGKYFPSESLVTYKRLVELKKKKIKIVYCFSGVGPFLNASSKKYAKKILEMIDFISVRDDASYKLCKEFGKNDNIEIWRDPVFLYNPVVKQSEKNTIAINVFFGADKSKIDVTEKAYIKLIENIITKYPEFKIKLFNSEMGDKRNTQILKKYFNSVKSVDFYDVNNEDELFDLYSKSIVVIGCRMHSLITAIISKVPVVAISWQQKVLSLMEYFDCEDFIISQDDFCNNDELIMTMIDNAISTKNDILYSYDNKIDIIKKETIQNIELFCKSWSEKI